MTGEKTGILNQRCARRSGTGLLTPQCPLKDIMCKKNTFNSDAFDLEVRGYQSGKV